MKVWVWRRCSFAAAHHLPDHPGVCANIHGHTYIVEVGVQCPVDPKTGMGIDLAELKDFLYVNVLASFDHKDLNDLFDVPPTAEMIAATVLDRLQNQFPDYPARARVFESPDGWVESER